MKEGAIQIVWYDRSPGIFRVLVLCYCFGRSSLDALIVITIIIELNVKLNATIRLPYDGYRQRYQSLNHRS
jgi:hypothetical protein